MQILDLFSGIGGFSVAGHALGWETAAFVERDKFCQSVLASRFGARNIEPHRDIEHIGEAGQGIPIYDDITTFSGDAFRGRVDIVTAAFPCQPFSAAGQRRGDTDDRFLWPETVRIVDEARPEWCVFENVAGLLSMVESDTLSELETKEIQLFLDDDDYRVNKVIERVHRRIVGRIITDLEAIGYSPLRMPDGTPVILCLPACAVGAWHRRDRLWIVAYRNDADSGLGGTRSHAGANGGTSGLLRRESPGDVSAGSVEYVGTHTQRFESRAGLREARPFGNGHQSRNVNRDATDFGDTRLQRNELPGTFGQGTRTSRPVAERFEYEHWLEAAGELCRVVHGLPEELDAADVQTLEQAVKCLGRDEAERAVGFDLGEIENRVWRTERLKALGNTIYPEVVLQVFGVIERLRTSDI